MRQRRSALPAPRGDRRKPGGPSTLDAFLGRSAAAAGAGGDGGGSGAAGPAAAAVAPALAPEEDQDMAMAQETSFLTVQEERRKRQEAMKQYGRRRRGSGVERG